VSALEQILFAKMQLVATVYHHHKIRAADSMLTSYVGYVSANPDDVEADEALRRPLDFLKESDSDWLGRDHGNAYLNSITRRLRDRDLPKRALVISSRTTVGNYVDDFTRLGSHPDKAAIMAELRLAILEELNRNCPGHGLLEHDLIVDLPAVPSLREASQTAIRTADGGLAILDEFFPSGGWLETYFSNKWQGHVFCPDGRDRLRLKVAKAARDVFRRADGLNIEFSDEAFIQARLSPADVENSY
jgi:HD superfamily phosphohydrolase